MPITPDNLPDDPAALKRIIAAMAQDALTAQTEIARLKFQLARYRRAEFGRSSEKLGREIEQLELALEALETDQAERLATAAPEATGGAETAAEAQKPAAEPRAIPAIRSVGGCAAALRRCLAGPRAPPAFARPIMWSGPCRLDVRADGHCLQSHSSA